jgi:hypothetical protein
MHTVIETAPFIRAAADAGMTEPERERLILTLASRPDAGDLIPETGGCRKLRLAGRGKGKSGGYRVITYFGGSDIPVFLLTVFSKGERANLRQAERHALAEMAKTLRASLGGVGRRLRRKT